MKTQFSLFTLIIALSSLGNAVSRVGGGKVESLQSGFELSIDTMFLTADLGNDSVRCLGPVGVIRRSSSISTGTQYFEISEFSREFPDATNLSKEDMISRFSKSNWVVEDKKTCELVLKSTKAGIAAYLVTWGAGKGFVIKGTDSMDTSRAIKTALSTLKITSECSWK